MTTSRAEEAKRGEEEGVVMGDVGAEKKPRGMTRPRSAQEYGEAFTTMLVFIVG